MEERGRVKIRLEAMMVQRVCRVYDLDQLHPTRGSLEVSYRNLGGQDEGLRKVEQIISELKAITGYDQYKLTQSLRPNGRVVSSVIGERSLVDDRADEYRFTQSGAATFAALKEHGGELFQCLKNIGYKDRVGHLFSLVYLHVRGTAYRPPRSSARRRQGQSSLNRHKQFSGGAKLQSRVVQDRLISSSNGMGK